MNYQFLSKINNLRRKESKLDKSIIGILGFALGGIGSVLWGILIVTKILPNIDKKLKIKSIRFF